MSSTDTALSAVEPAEKHPVDRVPPLRQLAPLGLQPELAMYAGAVAVPVIVGGALTSAGKLQAGDLPYLISADLLVAGIATLIQFIGFWRFGVRLPLMQGCTFAAVTPMIAIGSQFGVTAIYGSVIAAGLFMILMAPIFARLLHFFPPLVTGTVILIIGLSLMPTAAGWAGGGEGADDFGSLKNIAFALPDLVPDHLRLRHLRRCADRDRAEPCCSTRRRCWPGTPLTTSTLRTTQSAVPPPRSDQVTQIV